MNRDGKIGFKSYDRFFPNQDTLPEGGLGSLVALPLQGNARKKGNSVFVNGFFEPYPDQWEYLLNVGKISEQALDDILKQNANMMSLGDLSKTSESKPWEVPIANKIERTEFDAIFEAQVELIERLGNSLTLDKIKAAITGVDTSKEASFFSVWQDRINFFRTNNNGEQYTTAESYECAMKSFQKILWDRPITGFKVGKEDIEYWSNGMQNGVLNENGELIGQIREATRGLYLRNCRAVWNECVSRGYLTNQEYPFSNVKKKNLVAIPVGDTRKDHYLNVQQMTELYRVFVDKRYPDTWKKGYAEKTHYSLGLFLPNICVTVSIWLMQPSLSIRNSISTLVGKRSNSSE